MINRIIGFSISNKLIIGLFTLLLIGWGIYSITHIAINAVPDITNNQVQVITVSQNLAAQEVEQYITQPVEISLSNLPGVTQIRSISRFGLSVITVVFNDNMGIYKPRQLVSEQLKEAREQIDPGLGAPYMAPITTGLGEIYQYTVETKPGFENQFNATQLRTIQDWIIKRQLAGIPGVVEINSAGGYLKQYEIAVDPNRLNSYNLTIADIYKAVQMNNQNTGGSYIEHGSDMYYIRGQGLVKSLEDIRKIVITTRNNIPVTTGDVATVQIGHANRYGAATINGKGETVVGVVMMLKGANSVDVINAVKKRIAGIQKTLPEGIVIKPFIDRTKLIDKTTHTVFENLTLGGLIVIFVLVILLGTVRSGLIVASIIPLSLLFALGMMYTLGISANLLSLGALDFGIIVDGAVIIVEFMSVQLTKNFNQLSETGQPEKQEKLNTITFQSAGRMMNAATFGQIIILIVFLPILTLQGVEGKMFIPMALTFGFAILGAMILCLTYIPMVSSIFLFGKSFRKKNPGEIIMQWIDNKLYQPVIKTALRRKIPVITTALIFLGLAIFVYTNMGAEFMPKLQEGDFALEFRGAPGTSLEQTKNTIEKIENILVDKFPEVVKVVTRIGAAEVPTDPDPVEGGYLTVVLKPKKEWKSGMSYDELADKMKEALSVVPGISIEFSQPIEMRFNELLSGVKSDLAVKIYGEDLDILQQKGNEAASIIQSIKGAADVRPEQVTGLQQIVVKYNRDRIAQYGLNIQDINTLLRTALSGGVAGKFYQGERWFDIVIRLKKNFRQDIQSIRNLYIPLPSGGKTPLKEVADVRFEQGPNQISRDNTHRRIVINVNVRNRDIQSLVKEIRQKLDKNLALPSGYYVTYGGDYENLQRASKRLSIVVPVALFLIFIILIISLRSVRQTILIYTAIPFSAIGGVFSLWIRGMPFSISAGIGFIALFGVAVLNGLVLISYLNDLKAEGVSDVPERVLLATRSRLRPILLTASVDILGFMPMAISTSAGAEVQRPLATVVIGGILTSTILTLIILPLLYSITENQLKKMKISHPLPLLLPLLFLSFPGISQPGNNSRFLTEEKAIENAVKNNPGLQGSYLRIDQQQKLEKTAFDFGKTNLFTSNEEVNPSGSEYVRSLVGIGQTFEFPATYVRRDRLYKQLTQLSKDNYYVDRFRLKKKVSLAYYQWAVDWKKWLLNKYLDSVYNRFYEAASLRYKTGEASELEKLAAKSKQEEISLRLKQAESEFKMARVLLEGWMNTTLPDSVIPEEIESKLNEVSMADYPVDHNPEWMYQESKINTVDKEIKYQRSLFFPEISGQYAKQKINGEPGYYAWQLGINIPLWFVSRQGHVQAAKTEMDIQKKNLSDLQLSLNALYKNYMLKYVQLREQLQYYDTEGLPLSGQLIRSADLSFRTGEIGYVEYLQNIDRAVEIRNARLATLLQYNQTTIALNYLTVQ